jgi:hypothetical protein
MFEIVSDQSENNPITGMIHSLPGDLLNSKKSTYPEKFRRDESGEDFPNFHDPQMISHFWKPWSGMKAA